MDVSRISNTGPDLYIPFLSIGLVFDFLPFGPRDDNSIRRGPCSCKSSFLCI